MSIKIANPQSGGQSYTTDHRAEQFIRRGIAVKIDGVLHFLTTSPAENRSDRLREKELRELAGMVFWNGECKDPCAMKRPGEVRS